MISDSYDLKEVKGAVYEVDCAMITEAGVTVGPYFPFLMNNLRPQIPSDASWLTLKPTVDTGANASAEEAEEALEDGASLVNNVVNSFRLQSTAFDKKSYLAYLKGTKSFAKCQGRGFPVRLTKPLQVT